MTPHICNPLMTVANMPDRRHRRGMGVNSGLLTEGRRRRVLRGRCGRTEGRGAGRGAKHQIQVSGLFTTGVWAEQTLGTTSGPAM